MFISLAADLIGFFNKFLSFKLQLCIVCVFTIILLVSIAWHIIDL